MYFLEPDVFSERNKAVFERLKNEILDRIPYASVEHVGSSAVSGLVSKGDLDIYVEVPSEEFLAALQCLTELGFSEKADTLQTHQLRMLCTKRFSFDVAIQLVSSKSKFVFFKTFRDLLNQDENLKHDYNQLKLRCSSLDEDSYRKEKSDFIENVLASRCLKDV